MVRRVQPIGGRESICLGADDSKPVSPVTGKAGRYRKQRNSEAVEATRKSALDLSHPPELAKPTSVPTGRTVIKVGCLV